MKSTLTRLFAPDLLAELMEDSPEARGEAPPNKNEDADIRSDAGQEMVGDVVMGGEIEDDARDVEVEGDVATGGVIDEVSAAPALSGCA